jgi:hypothetical protein
VGASGAGAVCANAGAVAEAEARSDATHTRRLKMCMPVAPTTIHIRRVCCGATKVKQSLVDHELM